MKKKYCLITTTCDNEEIAKRIADTLLEERLVSCIQFININSKYHWKSNIEDSDEILLQMKSKEELYKQVEEIILKLHNYELPQIVMYNITDGYNKYLEWISDETK